MVQCVFGDGAEFIDEWEVSFKSVIFNAPLDCDLHVHIICDAEGATSVEERMRAAKLPGSRWRTRVSATVTNLRSREDNVRAFLRKMILNEENATGRESEWMDQRLGLGSFLRLFAYKYVMEYVPSNGFERREDLRMAFYLDTDVVVIANLNHLVTAGDDLLVDVEGEGKPLPIWVWGQGSSGFMGIDALRFGEFWDAVARCEAVRRDPWPRKNDQWLLGHVSRCTEHLNLASELPDPSPWSVHIGSGYRVAPHTLDRAAGMLHLQNPDAKKWFEDGNKGYNGKTPCTDKSTPGEGDGTCIDRYYVDKFCHRARPCISRGDRDGNLKAVRNTWGIADYYVRLSWEWTIYQAGESRIPPNGRGGHNFTLVVRDATSDF